MRQGFTALRHEPVGCVVTIIAGDHGAVHVFDVSAGDTSLVRQVQSGSERYADVHGSLVFIGALPTGITEIHAAVIYDLPDGRVKTTGTARVTPMADGRTRVCVESVLDDGTIRLDAICSGRQVADMAPQTRHHSN